MIISAQLGSLLRREVYKFPFLTERKRKTEMSPPPHFVVSALIVVVSSILGCGVVISSIKTTFSWKQMPMWSESGLELIWRSFLIGGILHDLCHSNAETSHGHCRSSQKHRDMECSQLFTLCHFCYGFVFLFFFEQQWKESEDDVCQMCKQDDCSHVFLSKDNYLRGFVRIVLPVWTNRRVFRA